MCHRCALRPKTWRAAAANSSSPCGVAQCDNCFLLSVESNAVPIGLLRPRLARAALRSPTYGVISVEVRLAIALRILAGGAAWDAAILFGLGLSTVYDIFWQVVDAINKADGVGRFYFPQDEDGCRRHADRFEVRVE